MPLSSASLVPPPLAFTVDSSPPFWQDCALADLTLAEWESLCDGCGKCCLHKLEDTDTGNVFYTNVACRLLDVQTGRCSRYAERFRWVPDCVQLTPAEVAQIDWLPATCAYRLRAAGQPLPGWHPLRSGDPKSTRQAGMSVCGRVIPEQRAKHLADYIIEQPLT